MIIHLFLKDIAILECNENSYEKIALMFEKFNFQVILSKIFINHFNIKEHV